MRLGSREFCIALYGKKLYSGQARISSSTTFDFLSLISAILSIFGQSKKYRGNNFALFSLNVSMAIHLGYFCSDAKSETACVDNLL